MKFADVKKNRIKMFNTPEFIQRIKDEDERMLIYLDILKEINFYGFITLESQSGQYKKSKNYVYNEKAYIFGFIEESRAEKFIKHFSINSDKNCLMIYTVDNKFDIPAKFDIPLTIEKKNNEIKVVTHMSTIIPKSLLDMYRKEIKINKSEKIILIQCIDPIFNRDAKKKDGLFVDVLKSLKSI
jgi:hypothetical protein